MRRLKILALLVAIVLVAVELAAGCDEEKATKTNGDAGEQTTGEIVKKKPADEQVLYDYFEAIDEKRYDDAYDLWSESGQSASFEEFKASYADYVDSVKVVSVTKLPEFSTPDRETFRVDLDARYIKNYPAGSGEIPMFWVVVPDPDSTGDWLIEAEGTGP
jgi:hypothetical protein